MRRTHRAGARVGLAAEDVLAAAEHLRPRLQLDVDLEPDHRFPVRHAGTPSPGAAAPRCRRELRTRPGTPPGSRSGIARPGSPAMCGGIVSTSARYIASGFSVFSPSLNATVGDVGLNRTSNRSNAAANSRPITVRTFCAWP